MKNSDVILQTPTIRHRLLQRVLAAVMLTWALSAFSVNAQDQEQDEPQQLTPAQLRLLERQARQSLLRGDQLRRGRRLQQAELSYRQALSQYRRLYPESRADGVHPQIVVTLSKLGLVLLDQAKRVEAHSVFAESLKLARQLYSADNYPHGHPDLAMNLLNLGVSQYHQGKLDAAKKLLLQALAMQQELSKRQKFAGRYLDMAICLNNLGTFAQAQIKYGEARSYFERSLAIYRNLYPPSRFPQGHPQLITGEMNLGTLLLAQGNLQQSHQHFKQALAMSQRFYPGAHPTTANALFRLAASCNKINRLDLARRYFEEALAMNRQIYPKEKYMRGHPDLAACLDGISSLLLSQGEYKKAEAYAVQALEMNQQLYPRPQYPIGHFYLVRTFNNMGKAMRGQSRYQQARLFYKLSLEMNQRLYPESKYPQGHPYVADSMSNLAAVLHDLGDLEGAQLLYEQHVAMLRRLYDETKFPQGHHQLAAGLSNYGAILGARGNYDEAVKQYEEAIGMLRRIFPESQYPQGFPLLSNLLNNLGFAHHAQGNLRQAKSIYLQVAKMDRELAEQFIASASEVEAMNFLAHRPPTTSMLLSASFHDDDDSNAEYEHIWQTRGLVQRAISKRQRFLHSIASPQVRKQYNNYLNVRRQLSQMMLAPATGDRKKTAARLIEIEKLSEQKERLERELAEQLPDLKQMLQTSQYSYRQLTKQLPPDTVVVDIVRYIHFTQDPDTSGIKGESSVYRYALFLLHSGQPATRLELQVPAKNIDSAVAAWREAIRAGEQSEAADHLRRMIWEPIEKQLQTDGKTTKAIYLCCDGSLTALPWAALPTSDGGVLLEKYQLAVLPHAQLLLDHLAEKRGPPVRGPYLLVGNVNYGQRPASTRKEKPTVAAANNPSPDPNTNQTGRWKMLAGAKQEVEDLALLLPEEQTISLTGLQASTSKVLAELSKARWAHLATHGFFADARFRTVRQIQELNYVERSLVVTERMTPGGRNPLTLTGLVLAGANVSREDNSAGVPRQDGGILTAESISGMNLQNLELAVLSACETGLGDVAGGEGVFGLQRAFHTAGARNVVASLWNVSDQATLAQMKLFYRKLRKDKLPPIEALRQAQLYLYRNPDAIPKVAALRGIDVTDTPLPPDNPKPKTTADTRLWAAFVLSGSGR